VLRVGTGLLVVAVALAAGPVGSISSKDAFRLRGKSVPVAGVPSWPLMAGDELATDQGPATLQFRDGSRVVLGKASKAKLEDSEGVLVLRLLEGSMKYTMAPKSSMRILAADRPVTYEPGKEGSLSVGSGPATGAFTGNVKTADLPPVSGRPRR